MKTMTKLFLSLFIAVVFSSSMLAQLTSIETTGSFSTAGSLKYAVTKANGFGGGVKINFKTFDNFYISISAGYQSFSIDQDSALTQWKWYFWDNRYYGSIRADLTDTAKYQLTITPNQGINSIPVSILVGYETKLGDLKIKPYAGAGIFFFSRWFYVVEDWTKKLTKLNSTFNYNYRNFAPSKQGNPIMLHGGISLEYPLFDFVNLAGEFNYTHFLETDGMGYSELPFGNKLNFKLGLSFSY
ncbi:hypothetical protein MASR1M107_10590 [Ignavibacteriales bacterium]